jgi:futalosine hydrolase
VYSIFVPTKKEAEQIFESDRFLSHNGFTVLEYKGRFVIITGIGKVNTAITVTKYLSETNTESASPLLLGIAGAYRGTLDVGELCMIDTDYFVDECLPTSNPPKLIGTHEMGFPVCDGNKIDFITNPAFNFPICSANTVSMLSGTDELANLYHLKTGASVESMEGAAFGLACSSFNIDVLQIRAVSNYCGERKNQQWNIKKPIQAIQSVLYLIG